MKKKKLFIIIGSAVLALLITGLILLIHSCSKNDEELLEEEAEEEAAISDQKRVNILRLAGDYAKMGEYDRALNLLDNLLINNPDDEDARSLQISVLGMNRNGGTEALLEAQRRFLEEQQRQNQVLANNLRNNPASSLSSSSSSEAAIATAQKLADIENARIRAAEQQLALEEAALKKEEERKKKEEEERKRLEDLQRNAATDVTSFAGANKGQSSGSESVEVNIGEFELD